MARQRQDHYSARVRGLLASKALLEGNSSEATATMANIGFRDSKSNARLKTGPAIYRPTNGEITERHWPKSLKVGYAAGAYDLFHIGHLNILRAARQRCDFLIAGVVSDEMCELSKGIKPFIPEDERLEIVRSISYVDEAVIESLPDKLDTWKMLRFTVFFKGEDWRGTPKGIDLENRFNDVGVDVEYFPYTLRTSSTKLRLALENLDRISHRQ